MPCGTLTFPRVQRGPPHAPRNCGDCGPQQHRRASVPRPASRPPELRRLRPHFRIEQTPVFDRLTPPGIAATAASMVSMGEPDGQPPHAPRNCGDCGNSHDETHTHLGTASRPPELRRLRPLIFLPVQPSSCRLTPPGIAATAAARSRWPTPWSGCPPHAPRNCGDCGLAGEIRIECIRARLTPPGIAATAALRQPTIRDAFSPASRPPELRRLRPSYLRSSSARKVRRLTPPGIAATAAAVQRGFKAVGLPPHAPRNCGDCGFSKSGLNTRCSNRLTPPGIAATAAEAIRVKYRCGAPPHAPRNCGDCGGNRGWPLMTEPVRLTPPGIAATAALSEPFIVGGEELRLTPPGIAATAAADFGDPTSRKRFRLTPPGIAATAAAPSNSPARSRSAPASRPPELRRLRRASRS